MQIGFSFFWPVILGWDDPNHPEAWRLAIPSIDESLNYFLELGIESIEIKLTQNMDLPLVFRAAEKLVHQGFQISFHAPSRLRFPDDLDQQLETLSSLATFMYQRFQQLAVVVVHPLNSKTQPRAEIITNTLEYLKRLVQAQPKIPARFALEILRNRAESEKVHSGDSYQELLDIVAHFEDSYLGICWDFGHASAMYQRGLQEKFPPPEFTTKVIHCHVHDCSKEKTHLPLGLGSVPIEQNIKLLQQYKYNGILNLELMPHKIDDPWNFLTHIESSVKQIQTLLGDHANEDR